MLPHESVYARLQPSEIHGIGVFAIRPIPKGTSIFARDRVEMVWVEKAKLEAAGLTPAEQALYDDFGVNKGDLIGCPVNFQNLTPGWYCNEPQAGEAPNVRVDHDLNFLALRDIAEGEELTILYSQFSDPLEENG